VRRNALIFLIFCVSSAMAEQKMHKFNLEKELIKDEWVGAENFISELTAMNQNVCEFVLENSIKYLDTPFVIRRVLSITERTQCSEKSVLISSHLKSSDVLIRAAAIRLAATLSRKEKNSFQKKMRELRKNESDPAIQESIANFFKDN
jgi:hypothetical protein